MASERMAYMRIARGLPSEQAQREALLSAGVPAEALEDPWIDRGKLRPGGMLDRDRMIGAMREGDEIHIERLGVLGTSEADILEFVREASACGAVICDASTGERFFIPPECRDAADNALRLARAIRASERAATLAKARANRKASPGKAKIEGARLEAAKVHWFNHDIDGDEAARRAGVSKRTLHRYFGPRETPAFGAALNKRRGKA